MLYFSQWNLVCDNGWLKSLSESLFTLGDIPGSMIFGQISDRYGRKTALMWVSIFNLIFGSLLAVSPNSSAYMALKTLVGATTSTQLIVVYVTGKNQFFDSHIFTDDLQHGSFNANYFLTFSPRNGWS